MTPEQRQLVLDYQITFDTDSGRRVKADLEKWSCFNDRIIPSDQPSLTGFELGRRDMFLHIKDKLDTRLDIERQETAESEVEDATD